VWDGADVPPRGSVDTCEPAVVSVDDAVRAVEEAAVLPCSGATTITRDGPICEKRHGRAQYRHYPGQDFVPSESDGSSGDGRSAASMIAPRMSIGLWQLWQTTGARIALTAGPSCGCPHSRHSHLTQTAPSLPTRRTTRFIRPLRKAQVSGQTEHSVPGFARLFNSSARGWRGAPIRFDPLLQGPPGVAASAWRLRPTAQAPRMHAWPPPSGSRSARYASSAFMLASVPGFGLASTRSTFFPSISTISKRQCSQSTLSPTLGRRPVSSMSIPLSV
jgi:hypothetical protein